MSRAGAVSSGLLAALGAALSGACDSAPAPALPSPSSGDVEMTGGGTDAGGSATAAGGASVGGASVGGAGSPSGGADSRGGTSQSGNGGTASSGGGAGGADSTSDAGAGGASAGERCPGAARLCVDGSAACDLGECPGQCDPSDCAGSEPDVTRVLCQDWTLGGPYCGRDDSGACSWQLRECPTTNECPEDDVFPCIEGTATMLMPPDCNTHGLCQVFCEPGTRYYVPGCGGAGDTLLPEEGCFVPCPQDGACPGGTVCTEVVTNPCAFSTCAACGEHDRVCIEAN